jgi:CheY-like chemotaxis protein
MANIFIVDKDEISNKEIRVILREFENIKARFFSSFEDAKEMLSGEPSKRVGLKEVMQMAVAAKNLLAKKQADERNALIPEKEKIENKISTALEKLQEKKDLLASQMVALEEAEGQLKLATATRQKAQKIVDQKKADSKNANTELTKDIDYSCHLLIVERSFLGDDPEVWVRDLRDEILIEENRHIPIVVVGHTTDQREFQKYLIKGISDYMIKPLDKLLLLRNFGLLSKETGVPDKQVYSIPVEEPVDVAFQYDIEEISEFMLTMRSPKKFKVDQYVTFYGDMFQTTVNNRLFARCTKCEEHMTEKGQYSVTVAFSGLDQPVRKTLRTWIRRKYVTEKEKAAN